MESQNTISKNAVSMIQIASVCFEIRENVFQHTENALNEFHS